MLKRRYKAISITIDQELVNTIDAICEANSSAKRKNYSRSEFITEAVLFLLNMSKELKERNETKEVN